MPTYTLTIVLVIGLNLALVNCQVRRYFERLRSPPLTHRVVPTKNLQDGPYFYDLEAINGRRTEYPIHPMILGRRSLREMSGEEMSDEELFPLFEAAKWAPSHFNIQEWRIIYAKRNTKQWYRFLATLDEGNRKWAKDASALVVMVSNRFNTHKGKKSFVRSHSFDTGAAWMAMALEGVSRGYVVHAMAGFDYQKAAKAIRMPNNGEYAVEVMIAIGKRKHFRQRSNEKTSERKSLREVVSEGFFSSRF